MATGSVFICLLIILPAIALLAPGRLHSRLQKPSRLILAATDNSDAPGDWLTELMSYFNTLAESFAPPSKSKVSAVKSVKIASQDAVLVFGSTGKTGQRIVEELIQSNRDVVLVGRDQNKLKTAFSAYLNEGKGVKLSGSINLADLSSLASEDLFLNVAQVISCIGPSFQDPASNSENIDFKANQRIIELFQNSRTKDRKVTANAIILSDFSASERKSASGLTGWSSLDDSIMGGKSSSKWSEVNWAGEGSDFCRWEGNISPEGGVFCGTVNKLMDKPNIDRFDGIRLTIRGDGNRYKFKIQPNESKIPYKAAFDTIPNAWMTIDIPFVHFYAVDRSIVQYSAPVAKSLKSGNTLSSISFVLSKIEFNGKKNPNYIDKPFQLDVKSIELYRNPRPEFVLISSAGAERINRLSTDEERKIDVPIVQLNPQGILNWKYKAEECLRGSGLSYCIIRPTGLASGTSNPVANQVNTDTANDGSATAASGGKAASVPVIDPLFTTPRKLDFFQGDTISGRVTREELAKLTVHALESGYTAGKTFEVRRDESESGKLASTTTPNNWGTSVSPTKSSIKPNESGVYEQDFDFSLSKLMKDNNRDVLSTIPPFPNAQDPPQPATPERVQEILADPRVKAQQARETAAGKN